MNLAEIKEKLRRQAVLMQIGGARPPADITASWFGKVNLALPGEEWPMYDDVPMCALCQINVKALPLIPPRIADLDLITIFIDPEELPTDKPNGQGWCLRAYKDISKLVPIEEPDTGSEIGAFPLFAELVDEDYPCHEDVDIELPQDIDDDYYDHFAGLDGFKIGGWPRLIQCEIYWAPYNKHPADFEFAFQIDSTEKGNWFWGDGGLAYFGRGRAPGHEDEWAMNWQCY